MVSRVEIIGDAVLYLGDCREILSTVSAPDLVVTDPPYGIDYDASHKKYKGGIDRGYFNWDCEPFDPAPIINLGLPSVIWGGNCFASKLPDYPGWLCWVKTARNGADIRQADMELAWTNCVKRSQVFRHLWVGSFRDSEAGIRNVHPTQKPIALMVWCIHITKIDGTVIDPYMGAGTTGVACANLGRSFVGVEKDERYFDIACERIDDAQRQRRLFP